MSIPVRILSRATVVAFLAGGCGGGDLGSEPAPIDPPGDASKVDGTPATDGAVEPDDAFEPGPDVEARDVSADIDPPVDASDGESPRCVGDPATPLLGAFEPPAVIGTEVVFPDPSVRSELHAPIRSNVTAAVSIWSRQLVVARSTTLTVRATFGTDPSISAASVTSAATGTTGVFEMGAAAELRTGTDPNGAEHDVVINFDPTFVDRWVWFDPDPNSRTTPVPSNKSDAVSTFLHEIGHALFFSGWLDSSTGASRDPRGARSSYDVHVRKVGEILRFSGPQASVVYPGGVPLTTTNYAHYGNRAPLPGGDLDGFIMWGPDGKSGVRFVVNDVDRAIARDVGFRTHRAVGAVSAAGNASFASSLLTLRGGGAGPAGTADAFELVDRAYPAGEVELVARLRGRQGAARCGIVLRSSLAPNAASIAIVVDGEGIATVLRPSAGGAAAVSRASRCVGGAPTLRLSRASGLVTAAISSDGKTFESIGTASITGAIFGGLISASGDRAAAACAFDRLQGI
jgi:hypothetical protein